ncbi:MAG: DUF192 domain-containing protein [Patescibacteria group bacterium]|nr:DUF192 domain-containing protein [Patescibacteria group bacterium]
MHHQFFTWWLGVVGGLGVCLVLAAVWYARTIPVNRTGGLSSVTVTVGGVRVVAEVAATPEEQERGLSGRVDLAEGTGMLFPFRTPTRPTFWMRGMLFPIDIIWIRGSSVVGMSENLPVPRVGIPLPMFSPPTSVTAALEVPAGFARRHQLQVGSAVVLD